MIGGYIGKAIGTPLPGGAPVQQLIDRWLQPLSEPRRFAFKGHLPIALYPSLFSEAEFLRANYGNVDKVTLHGRHTGTIELIAKHQGTVVLHGIPKGDLPEAI